MNQNNNSNDKTSWDPVISYINNLTETNTFNRSSIAYKQDGTQVSANVPRYEAGKFGTAVMIEEGTTNLLTTNQSSAETDLTDWNIGGAQSASLSRVSEGWNGSYAVQANLNAGDSFVGFGGLQNTAGSTYTFSAYAKGTAGQQIKLCYNDGTGELSSSNFTLTSNWQRFTYTFTISGSATTLSTYIRDSTGAAQTFYVDGCQVENKPYATSWMIGGLDRAAEGMTIPTAGVLSATQGTIELSAYIDPTGVHSGRTPDQSTYLFSVNTSLNNMILINRNFSSKEWYVYFSNANGVSNIISLGSITTPGWYNFAVSWQAGVGGYAYLNGVYKGSVAANYLPTTISSPVAYIGSLIGSFQFNQLIDDLRISNRLRTVAEIQSAYQTNQPLPVDADTTCKINFDDYSLYSLIHLGEKKVNLSGNFSRTYTDMELKTPGFALDVTRTYNSGDDRTGGLLSTGWSSGFQGSLRDYLSNQKIVRLPNGSAMTFTKIHKITNTPKNTNHYM